MGFFSRFESKMEGTLEGVADKFSNAPVSPAAIAKKAEKKMHSERMVGNGKQYAPTLYTVLVNPQDDRQMMGYYPTMSGELETMLKARSAETGLTMDGQPLVRFIADNSLKAGKFDIVAETVAAPIVEQLRDDELQRYGITRGRYEADLAQKQAVAADAAREARREELRQRSAKRSSGVRNPFKRDAQEDFDAGQARPARTGSGNPRARSPFEGFGTEYGRVEEEPQAPQQNFGYDQQAGYGYDDQAAYDDYGYQPEYDDPYADPYAAPQGKRPLPYVPEDEIDRSIDYGEYTFNSMNFQDYHQEEAALNAQPDPAELEAMAQAEAQAQYLARMQAEAEAQAQAQARAAAQSVTAQQAAARAAAQQQAAAQYAAPANAYQQAAYQQPQQYAAQDPYQDPFQQPVQRWIPTYTPTAEQTQAAAAAAEAQAKAEAAAAAAQEAAAQYRAAQERSAAARAAQERAAQERAAAQAAQERAAANAGAYRQPVNFTPASQIAPQAGALPAQVIPGVADRQPEPLDQTMLFNGRSEAPRTMLYTESNKPAPRYRVRNLQDGRSYTLTGTRVFIGRENTCNIVVPDSNASRHHAELRATGKGTWKLTDLQSTNGTFLNGQQVTSAILADGDRITVGTTDLVFVIC